jgi:hypothetical protein
MVGCLYASVCVCLCGRGVRVCVGLSVCVYVCGCVRVCMFIFFIIIIYLQRAPLQLAILHVW